jgi:hypothetical protein
MVRSEAGFMLANMVGRFETIETALAGATITYAGNAALNTNSLNNFNLLTSNNVARSAAAPILSTIR